MPELILRLYLVVGVVFFIAALADEPGVMSAYGWRSRIVFVLFVVVFWPVILFARKEGR
jgi:uncharacterized membrane protein YtjA (UPF0391 family)